MDVVIAGTNRAALYAYLDGLHNYVVDNLGMGKPNDLVQGTLDLLILKTISLEPMHGWAIAKRIQQVSGEVLQVQQGSLYPALHRLEQQAWINERVACCDFRLGRGSGAPAHR